MRKIADSTKQEALKIFSNMRQINDNEMIARVGYIDHKVNRKLERAGAICGGRKACLVGSLYLAGGVKPQSTQDWAVLPGVEPSERENFLRNKRGLKAAYKALNEAAEQIWDEKNPEKRESAWGTPLFGAATYGAAEALFEGTNYLKGTSLRQRRDRIADLIDRAERILSEA